ncbi:hypothetical protein Jann_1348 [Jannaschia sp. CCS1]|nr:hypothetical protein Jann_1348 [Jannaschia sp. CCS1]
MHFKIVTAYIGEQDSYVGRDRRAMAFLAAAILLAAFIGNVILGASSNSAILGNVGEMLLLLSASILFVIGILKKEADAKAEAAAAQARVDDVQGGH